MIDDGRRLTVEDEQDGLRLDNFLTALLPDHSRSQIQRLIKDGHVRGSHTLRASSGAWPERPGANRREREEMSGEIAVPDDAGVPAVSSFDTSLAAEQVAV